MIKMLVNHPDDRRLRPVSSLLLVAYGASPIREAVLSAAMRCCPASGSLQAYGMTELRRWPPCSGEPR